MRFAICIFSVGLHVTATAHRLQTFSRVFGGSPDENRSRDLQSEIIDAEVSLLNLKSFLLQLNSLVATRTNAPTSRTGPASMFESYTATFGAGADPNFWYIFPKDAQDFEPGDTVKAKYVVGLGQEQVLGWRDASLLSDNVFRLMQKFGGGGIAQEKLQGVTDEQCAVEIAADGTHAMLYALGTQPTGYKEAPEHPWSFLQPGQSVALPHYGKISLAASDPDFLVFKLGDGYLLQQEEAAWQNQQQPDYPPQQPGYPQYPQ